VRIDKAKAEMDRLYFIPEHPFAKESLEKFYKLKDQLD
jgi:hypothetical protein